MCPGFIPGPRLAPGTRPGHKPETRGVEESAERGLRQGTQTRRAEEPSSDREEEMTKWDFWIDRGGTFTDLVARKPDGLLKAHNMRFSFAG